MKINQIMDLAKPAMQRLQFGRAHLETRAKKAAPATGVGFDVP